MFYHLNNIDFFKVYKLLLNLCLCFFQIYNIKFFIEYIFVGWMDSVCDETAYIVLLMAR